MWTVQTNTGGTPIVKLRASANSMTLNWDSVSGGNYQVYYKSALTNNTWLPLGTPITATAFTASYTDIPPVGSKMRFYKVLRQ